MSKKKKDWKTEKERLLRLDREERRKEYRRQEFISLDKIPTWREENQADDKEEEKELTGGGGLGDKVSLYKGDITVLEVDAIVNAEKRLQRSWSSKPGSSPVAKNLVVRSKSYNVPMLTPVVEYDVDSPIGGGTGIRRHSVSEMTSCVEESGSVAESSATSTSSLANHSTASAERAAVSDTVNSSPQPRLTESLGGPHLLQPQLPSPGLLPEPSPGKDTLSTGSPVWDSPSSSGALAQDTSSGPSPSSSPEIMMGHILESLDSEPEQDGIFLDFSRRCSVGSTHSRDSGRQSVA